MHHIAIFTPNLENMQEFYLKLPGLYKLKQFYESDGRLRSVWLQQEGEKPILMLERKPSSKAAGALIFSAKDGNGNWYNFKELIQWIEHKTDYTFYFSDPDKNMIGYSSYPEKLPF
ncbi:MAG: VOC family protein [Leptospiraceae bacterium]|nr:VOC family protein [Leptospiraceae bacterium]MCP5502153.1 VOC family protein [Leptospiraceae bacterium]